MSISSSIKKHFSKKELLLTERYKSSKFSMVLFSFLFFVNYYLVVNSIFLDILSKTLVAVYVIFVIALVSYLYYFIRKALLGKIPSFVIPIISVVCVVIWWALMVPFVL